MIDHIAYQGDRVSPLEIVTYSLSVNVKVLFAFSQFEFLSVLSKGSPKFNYI